MYHVRSSCNQTTYPIAVAINGTTFLHVCEYKATTGTKCREFVVQTNIHILVEVH